MHSRVQGVWDDTDKSRKLSEHTKRITSFFNYNIILKKNIYIYIRALAVAGVVGEFRLDVNVNF